MTAHSPIILWFRRDLRLSDHAALTAAVATGRPVIPVFLYDNVTQSLGAAPKFRLGLGLAAFAASMERCESRLILRRGDDALEMLQQLVAQTGAGAVYWTRLYDPDSVARDSHVKKMLKEQRLEARSFGGHLMFEPWTVETKTGGFYRVFTPFWKTVRTRSIDAPLDAPNKITAPDEWPESERLEDWNMAAPMRRGAAVVQNHAQVGEDAAQCRLAHFCEDIISSYQTLRDIPGADGTSRLSQNLALGEVSPHQCWAAGQRAMHEGAQGAETFLKELVWREFAYHLMHYTPHILTSNWRSEWERFPWQNDPDSAAVLAWKQGRTGIPFVDAAMRELYVTGLMHNRARMIVASYLTKHLMTDWRIGQRWFEECLIDWDPASNAMGWQWSAGSGPDATPYFRVFNPETQLDKFDKNRSYADRWIAEGKAMPHPDAVSYFEAVPRSWGRSAQDHYPSPIVTLADGRARALAAYQARDF